MRKVNNFIHNLVVKQTQFKINYFSLFLIILGIATPFLLLTYINYYCEIDIATFNDWANCWNHDIYITCQPSNKDHSHPNYPSVGMILSAGAIKAISSISGIADLQALAVIFRYYLALFDALNFLLFIWLANLMQFRFPILIGLILLITPSTWIGGAIWGQIDNITLFFCLLSSLSFFQSWLVNNSQRRGKKIWINGFWLFLGVLNFCFYILTKQLAIFSLPFFLIIFLITIWKFWKNFSYKGLFWILAGLVFLILSFAYLDSLFEVPDQFHNSSYRFVWQGGGSGHAGKISGNGFNIWMFLGRDMWSSSDVPFFTLNIGNFKNDISPHQAGNVLYEVFIVFLLFSGFKKIFSILRQKRLLQHKPKIESYLIAFLCFFHGFSYLGFNVLLVGTHERYLYLGYPFLLIAVLWLYANRLVFSWQSIIVCFFAALAYGCFVFSIIGPIHDLLFAFRRHEFLASLHLFLMIFLLDLWVKICYFEKRNLRQGKG